ncbi:monooxygenase FAD-binding protein [Actinobacteria bacterium OK074]|nr:monooxygenase FAD-binding protein [Actinobacteria bacterium OK074]
MSRRAVVIGAGQAGMLAAAALSRAVDEVVVLDRDGLPDGPEYRKGLPQGRHAHLLMPGGQRAMAELLPEVDLRERLLAAGAHDVPLASGMVALTPEGWLHRWRHDEHRVITCSRALLDHVVRATVVEQTGVEIRRAEAVGLLGTRERVLGVRATTTEPTTGSSEVADLDADFVVDASGRGSRSVRWLAELGIDGVTEETVDAGLCNATRIYRVPEGAERFPMTLVQADPYAGAPGRSATVVPIEGNRWMVSLAGSRGGEPPSDPDGFLQYTLDLPHPLVGQLIEHAEPLTEIAVSRSTSNARRYLEKLRAWPEGLLVLGDALATFNPVYGQGMAVAALGARALDEELRRGDLAPGLGRRVQRAAARSVEAAWAMSVGQDVWFPDVRGRGPNAVDRLVTRYTRRLTKAATGSYAACAALWDVTGLTEGPTRLLRPGALLSTLNGPLLPPLSGPPLTPYERGVLNGLAARAS